MESPSFEPCEDEIDLRELIMTLWRGKWVIIAMVMVAVALALVASLRVPQQYEASALVNLSKPKLQINVQNGFTFSITPPDIKTVMAAAKAPAVFQALVNDPAVQAAWQNADSPLKWESLASKAKVTPIGTQGLRLTFQDGDPQRVALLVNRWAGEVVREVNQMNGYTGVATQLATEVQRAHESYQAAETAYIQALAQDRQPLFEEQLAQARKDLGCVLGRESELQRLNNDLDIFAEHLRNLPADATLSLGDNLTLVALEQRVLVSSPCGEESEGVPIQWRSSSPVALTAKQAINIVKALQPVLEQRAVALPQQQATIEAKVLHLRESLESAKAHLGEVAQQRDVAWASYHALGELQAKGQALAAADNRTANVSATAIPPSSPTSPNVAMNVALAAVLGITLGVMVILIKAWWKNGQTASSHD